MQWYLKVLRQYADFHGRARRTEFWMFVLFNILVALILTIIDSLLGFTYMSTSAGYVYYNPGILSSIYSLAVLIPTIAVSARRLHDIGRTGWWTLIWLVPIVGTIVLIVFWATQGERGMNKYGADPMELAAPGSPGAQPHPA